MMKSKKILGRPTNQLSQKDINPLPKAINDSRKAFLDYMCEIGLPKGIVFDKKTRKELNQNATPNMISQEFGF